jgi:hypothetical protein
MKDYDSDFSNAKTGDWAYGRHGWVQIEVGTHPIYPIKY